MRDWLGKKIKEGSKIVYPVRSGSSMWMNQATVSKVEYSSLRVCVTKGWINSDYMTTITRVDRVTVIE